jgi:hypothetical protein
LSASTGSPTSRPKPPSATDGFARRTEFANPDRRGTCVDQPLSRVGLSKSEIALSKREVRGVRCVGMRSTPAVPSLRYVRGQPIFDAGTTLVPALLGRNPDELENSEDRRSAGGHGNQHVRLRIAQVDHIETFCPALAALCCFEPRQTSGAGFRPAEDFRTSPRETARPAERRCIDGLAGSVDAVRRFAAQALAFAPPNLMLSWSRRDRRRR